MARVQSIEAALGEVRAATAPGGAAATVTLQTVALASAGTASVGIGKFGAEWISVSAFNDDADSSSVGIGFNPWLSVLITTDDNLSFSDYSGVAQDNDTGTVITLSSLNTRANGDMIYVGSHIPFRGLDVQMSAALNATASVLTADIWNGSVWEDMTITDGTIATGATFGQDGTITWTIPASWARGSLNSILTGTTAFPDAGIESEIFSQALYWVRFEVSAQLDSSATAESITSLNRSTAYMDMFAGGTFSMLAKTGFGGLGCVEIDTSAGTLDVAVNIGMLGGGVFSGGGSVIPILR